MEYETNDLMSLAEVSRYLGWPRSRVWWRYQRGVRETFPDPSVRIGGRPYWKRDLIEAFSRQQAE